MAGQTFVDKLLIDIELRNHLARKGIDQVGFSTERLNKNLKKANSRLGNFDMRLLGLMFGGMAMARAFGGMFRGILTTFLKAEDSTSGLAQATTRLHASWEFLKFSIFDALNTEWFIGFIDGIVNAINWVSQLPGAVKIAILAVIASLALIGMGAMILGQVGLAWKSVFAAGGLLPEYLASTKGSITKVKTALIALKTTAAGMSLAGLTAALAGAAVAALALYAGLKLADALTNQFNEKNAPAFESVYGANADNMESLTSATEGTTQEFSNMRAGMDSTLQVMQVLNPLTGELNNHIFTQKDRINAVTTSNKNWVNENINIQGQLKTTKIDMDELTQSIKDQVEAWGELDDAKSSGGSGDDTDTSSITET